MNRRGLLGGAAAAAAALSTGGWPTAPVWAQLEPPIVPAGDRIALLMGNRDYPDGQDLPSMHTNVSRLGDALQALGFRVTAVLDQSRTDAIRALEQYGDQLRSLPADGTSLFYFCGHGMQIDAENFLLPAGVFPRFRPLSESRDVYVALQRHVLEVLTPRPQGQKITVIDACRTSLKPLKDASDDGLNQLRVREGEMVVFSTSAGKPALAPISPTRMTFYTDELVRQLERQARQPEELSFRDLFRSVGFAVTRVMLNHPVEDIRALAQVPYIADNVRVPVRVAPGTGLPAAEAAPPAPPASSAAELAEAERQRALREATAAAARAAEERDFAAISEALWPAESARRARAFLQQHPNSRFQTAAAVAGEGAEAAAARLRAGRADLFQRDFVRREDLGQAFNEDLRRATSGDKEASARVAEAVRGAGGSRAERSYVAWMTFAAELGNGIAAYDLSRHFADVGQAALAGQWETLARRLGYVVPPRLRATR